jgi:hypothetical protein
LPRTDIAFIIFLDSRELKGELMINLTYIKDRLDKLTGGLTIKPGALVMNSLTAKKEFPSLIPELLHLAEAVREAGGTSEARAVQLALATEPNLGNEPHTFQPIIDLAKAAKDQLLDLAKTASRVMCEQWTQEHDAAAKVLGEALESLYNLARLPSEFWAAHLRQTQESAN